MTLFDSPQNEPDDRFQPVPKRPRWSRRRRAAVTWLSIAAVLALGMAAVPAPYVIEQPGPVSNTLGTIERDGAEIPMISIDGAPTYDTAGALDLLTVSVVGNRETRPNWFQIASAWFDSSKAVMPVDSVFPANQTSEERNQVNEQLMVDSQQEAIAAALTQQGIAIDSSVQIVSVAEGAPAEGHLEAGDIILTVAGEKVGNVSMMQKAIRANGTDSPVAITYSRDGTTQKTEVTPIDSDGILVIGVSAANTWEFPVDVEIQIDNVGGPSAGMMFALGIIDKMTPGELNGGRNVAGTGTINAEGVVGSIGGIRQKLAGAKEAGAEYFLAPAANCGEVVGFVPDGLEVFSVQTLDEAVKTLGVIAEGGTTNGLSRCTSG